MGGITPSEEFKRVIRGYKGCEALTDLHVKLIAVFLRAIDTPHYRCNINFKSVKAWDNGVSFNWRNHGGLATFDFRELTQLVLYAHQEFVRISLEAAAPGLFRVGLFQREAYCLEKYKAERGFQYHPSLAQAVNSQFQTQWIQDQKG